MKTVRYGAHTVKSFPSLRMDCRSWKIGITIFCERDGMITMRGFQPKAATSPKNTPTCMASSTPDRSLMGRCRGYRWNKTNAKRNRFRSAR